MHKDRFESLVRATIACNMRGVEARRQPQRRLDQACVERFVAWNKSRYCGIGATWCFGGARITAKLLFAQPLFVA